MQRLVPSCLALVLIAATQSPWAPGTYTYVTTLGRDTIAFEQGVARGDSVIGTVLRLDPQLSRIDYRVARRADGSIAAAELTYRARAVDGWGPMRHVRLHTEGDSAVLAAEGQPERRLLAPTPALSVLGSGALIALALDAARRGSIDSLNVAFVAPFGGPGGRLIARRRGDEFEYRLSGGFARVTFDRVGGVASIDGSATTLKERIAKARPAPLEAIEARWLRAGAGGTLSSRDTLTARVAAATITVDYGRPAVRGRDVFAHGVLGDTLWRTGANAATQFTTSHPLVFGGTVLPAGSYSLFTRVSPTATELIVSGRTGIWGTQYRAADDVLRVPMEVVSGAFTERFTISVEATDTGGLLRLRWERREFRVPFTLAP